MERKFFPEIQGLRAIAVVMVLVYHLWPELLSGGYIGVDVFFVVSGFIITQLLYVELRATKSINLVRFFKKRVLRLLPSSLLVLLFVALLLPFVPRVNLEGLIHEMLASVFYVQNWNLSFQAADYLGGDVFQSPLKHFWTLSVEEQFYILWPGLLVLMSFAGFGFFGSLSKALWFFTVFLVAVSAAYSYWITQTSIEAAYFSTFSRAWQFLVGGLCAFLYVERRFTMSSTQMVSMLIVGLALVFYSSVFFNEYTAFPGVAAWVPTAGAAMAIVAVTIRGDGASTSSLQAVLGSAPLVFLGGISYALYLWHWPIIFLFDSILGGDRYSVVSVAVVLISLALAWVTTRFLEDPVRRLSSLPGGGYVAVSLPLVSFCMVLALAFFTKVATESEYSQTVPSEVLPVFNHNMDPNSLVPNPLVARRDNPEIYASGCHQNSTESTLSWCDFGSTDAERMLVLIGDSHAASLMPAIKRLVESSEDYSLRVVTKSACALNETPVYRSGQLYRECVSWNAEAMKSIVDWKPHKVIVTQSRGHRAYGAKSREESSDLLVAGLVSTYGKLIENSIDVVAVADVPWHDNDVPECLTSGVSETLECATERSAAFRRDDAVVDAAKKLGLPLVDLSDVLCDDNICPPNRGNVLMWRDAHHLTATFSRMLAGIFVEEMELPIVLRTVESPLAERSASDSGAYVGELICSGLAGGDSIALRREVAYFEGSFTYYRGEYLSFFQDVVRDGFVPEELSHSGIEVWHGILSNNGEVEIYGWYSEGSNRTKSLGFSGDIVDSTLKISGKRGPRECHMEAVLVE